MSAIPILYTPRLVLRPLTLADASRVQELVGDERVARTTANIPHPCPDGAAERWIGRYEAAAGDGRQYNFAVTLAGTRTPGRELDPTDTGHLIGGVNIGAFGEPSENQAALGFWIGVFWWNKGFAAEAARAVVDFAFTRRGYDRVVACHFSQNQASGRALQKIGMAPTGETTHQYFPARARSFDVVHYAFTREAWSRRRIIHRWKPATPPQAALAAT